MAVGEADNISRCLLSISTLLGACRALWRAEGEAFFPWALGVHKGQIIIIFDWFGKEYIKVRSAMIISS